MVLTIAGLLPWLAQFLLEKAKADGLPNVESMDEKADENTPALRLTWALSLVVLLFPRRTRGDKRPLPCDDLHAIRCKLGLPELVDNSKTELTLTAAMPAKGLEAEGTYFGGVP